MKRRLQVLALCAAALLAVRTMAQDNAGTGGGGDASGQSSGSTDNSGASSTGGQSTNGGATGGTPMPAGGARDQNGGGTGAMPGTGDLFAPVPEATGEGSTIAPAPAPSAPPWEVTPVPGTTPAPSPAASPAAAAAGTQGAAQAAPVTLTLPGGYGGIPAKSFTLGQGRLAKPPVTFSVTVSQGYDDNIFSADSHIEPAPTPVPQPTPPLEERLIGFRISPPSPPTPIFQTFRPKAAPTPSVATPQQLGVVGSPVSTLSLGMQVQSGTPRTVLVMDASLGAQDYWNQPGQQVDYTGSLSLSFVHRLTPRATLSISVDAVYQKTPDFALINAPTNNGSGGDYLNGTAAVNLTYQWTERISTVTTYSLNANLLETDASNNLYENTIGTQFRCTVSARNTVTAELREAAGEYPSDSAANTTSTFYLLGLDTSFSPRLRNTISGGIESQSFSSGGESQTLPYMESATTLDLPRGAALTWTNRYGAEESGSPDQTVSSYRTALSYSQPLSTKLTAFVSLAYNDLQYTDTSNSAGSYTQKQLQASLSLEYAISPRFSLSLSYTYNQLITNEVNASYHRDQIFLGGTYMFR